MENERQFVIKLHPLSIGSDPIPLFIYILYLATGFAILSDVSRIDTSEEVPNQYHCSTLMI